MYVRVKMKTKKYHTVRTVLKYNRKILERGKIDTINTQIHDRSLSWPSTGTSIERFLGMECTLACES